MNLESSTSFVLRYGAIIGVVIVAIGVVTHLIGLSYYDMIMTAGIAVIVFTPFAAMIVSFLALSMNREKMYAVAALALIAITILGMLVAFWLR